jgi:GNAT superfamily N-acetyltransferase
VDPFEVRLAAEADAEAIADVWLSSRQDALGQIPAPVHSDDEVRRWIRFRLIAKLECWVAEAPDRELVGLLALEDGWVDQLYVRNRLQARGVGSALLEQAKRLRPDGLQLWTFASNLAARHFYEQRGFTATEQTDGADNEERAPDVHYVWAPGEWNIPRS